MHDRKHYGDGRHERVNMKLVYRKLGNIFANYLHHDAPILAGNDSKQLLDEQSKKHQIQKCHDASATCPHKSWIAISTHVRRMRFHHNASLHFLKNARRHSVSDHVVAIRFHS